MKPYSIGIDVGQRMSGIAIYSSASQPPIVESKWEGRESLYGKGYESSYSKDVTSLLYTRERKFVAWGTRAILMYAKMNNDERSNHVLIENFKTQLSDPDGLYKVQTEKGWETLAAASENQFLDFLVIDCVVDMLRELKKVALERLGKLVDLSDNKIQFVVSLPAYQGEDLELHIQKYRQAIKDAGLDDAVLLLSEPKAATITAVNNGDIKANGIYMIIDAGGGTSDINTSKITDKIIEGVENVLPSTSFAGSTFVDEQFWKKICEISPLLIKYLRLEEPIEYIKIAAEFEKIKCSFDPSSSRSHYNVKMGSESRVKKLIEMFPDLAERLNSNGEISFSREEILSFFEPTLNAITSQIKEQQELLTKQGLSCNQLLFVGGYSQSKAFQLRMEQEFPNHTRIFPDRDGGAVHRGAAWFGANPNIYRRPLAPYTYGFKTASLFDSSIDAPHRGQIETKYKNWFGWEWTETERFTSELTGEHLCRGRFDIQVEAGKSVNKIFASSIFTPTRLSQNELVIEIYRSDKQNIRYVDDASCKKIGILTVKRDINCSAKDWRVAVSIRFHQEQIDVNALDLNSSKECSTKIEFTPIYKHT